jgi:hypothetical protein
VSHKRYVIVLAHYSHPGAQGTPVPADVAAELVRRLAAEPIRQGVIRMFGPGSIFASPLKAALPQTSYIPEKLPPAEVEGTYFDPPLSANESSSNVPRMRYLPRFREIYGDDQVARSV